MEIKNQEEIVVGRFYWLTYLDYELVGMALDWYGEIRFAVTGFNDYVEFDSVSNIHPVCLIKH